MTEDLHRAVMLLRALGKPHGSKIDVRIVMDAFEAVRKDEREECAKICDSDVKIIAKGLAYSIRKRNLHPKRIVMSAASKPERESLLFRRSESKT